MPHPAAMGQMTTAARTLSSQLNGARRAAPKRRRKARAAAPKRRRKARAASRPARLVKGSAAAKRYMASIRRKRK